MNIKEALKETGKAHRSGGTTLYVQLDCFGVVEYLEKTNNNFSKSRASLENLMRDDWQPYHPKEEIRPKEAGELWHCEIDKYPLYVIDTDSGLAFIYVDKDECVIKANVIHNQNGWKRLYPEVPNENEIVIENVMWFKSNSIVFPEGKLPKGMAYEDLRDKPPMTMKLIPKE